MDSTDMTIMIENLDVLIVAILVLYRYVQCSCS